MKFQISFVLALFLSLATQAYSQACVTPNTSHWRMTTIAEGMTHPVAMSMAPGDSVVFMAEMWSGNVVRYTPGGGVDTLKTLEVYVDKGKTSLSSGYNTGIENGLLGIAVDPGFNENNWIYVFYSRRISTASHSAGDNNIHEHEHVLSRFTVVGNGLQFEKVLMKVPRYSARHAGGGMDINPITRELYIGTGDDTHPANDKAKWGPRQEGSKVYNSLAKSANTNDLRGKVLRIIPIQFSDSESPTPGIGSTYEIPEGNLYAPSAYTRAEVYTMGHRNPYHVRIDPYTNWAMVGDVGPDAVSTTSSRGPIGHDEFNLISSAGNYGWPFAVANNIPYVVHQGEPGQYVVGQEFDLDNLKNYGTVIEGTKQGLINIPPARSPLAWYNEKNTMTGAQVVFADNDNKESAIGGPMYHYNDTLSSVTKWPAYYNGKFIVADYASNKIFSLELSEDTTLARAEMIREVDRIVDLDFGPKGELYVLQYATAGNGYHGSQKDGILSKLEYVGPQYNMSQCSHYVPPKYNYETTSTILNKEEGFSTYQLYANLSQASSLLIPEGVHSISVYDLQGQEIAVLSNFEGKQKVTMPKILGHDGVVYLKYHR